MVCLTFSFFQEMDRGGHLRSVWGEGVRGREEHPARVQHQHRPLLPPCQQELQVNCFNHIINNQHPSYMMNNLTIQFAFNGQSMFQSDCKYWLTDLIREYF